MTFLIECLHDLEWKWNWKRDDLDSKRNSGRPTQHFMPLDRPELYGTAAAVPTITIIGQWCLYNLSRGLVIHATQQRKEQSAHSLQINRDLLPGL